MASFGHLLNESIYQCDVGGLLGDYKLMYSSCSSAFLLAFCAYILHC